MKTFLLAVSLSACPWPAFPALQGGSPWQSTVEWPVAVPDNELDDDGLERRFEGLLSGELRTRELDVDYSLEACLVEMARRGGPRWLSVVERVRAQWAELQRRTPGESSTSPLAGRGDLELWIAQRRLEGKPDPALVVLRDGTALEFPFPTLPEISFAIELADGESARPTLKHGVYYRSERFECFRVEAAAGEAPVAPHQSFMCFGGTYQRGPLGPDESIAHTIDLADYISPESPGPFRLRLRYHDTTDIADPEVDLERRLTVDSAPFELRWTPLVLARADVERADVAKRLAALDELAPVPIARSVWRPGARCVFDLPRPERDLLQAGWNALPGLLEALEDCEATPGRRAWLFALLFDLTGAVDPRAHPGAVGRFRERAVFEQVGAPESPWGQASTSFETNSAPSAEVQEMLAERWAVLARLVLVE